MMKVSQISSYLVNLIESHLHECACLLFRFCFKSGNAKNKHLLKLKCFLFNASIHVAHQPSAKA